MVKLASWNINSLKVRLEHVLQWLEANSVDVLALQETKLMDEYFPSRFVELGYHVAYAGQKTYNGVAIISRYPLQDVISSVPDFIDPQKRILAATIGDLRVVNLYVPNGATIDSDKYTYKLAWLKKTAAYVKQQLEHYKYVAVVGDFNIAPADIDVHDPLLWQNSVLVSPAEREAFAELLALGLVDSYRELDQQAQEFSWWDYRAGSFRRNLGLRIDHVLLSQGLQAICKQSQIDREPRQWERPSDHAPVWVELDFQFSIQDL